MEFGTGPRYSQHAATNYAHGHYCYNNSARPNPRVGAYPMGGPVCGPRFRGMGRDENMENGGQARRRISVACARCRKRKIRCSGDPGDGSGCHNCQQAGLDPNLCQFHRVGSGEATRVLEGMNLANNLNNMSHLSIFNNGGPVRQACSVPQLDTRPTFTSTWTVPYQEETSPVENYSLDPPNAYLPTNPNIMAPTYGNNYRWNQTHDPGMFNGLSYSQGAVRAASSAETTSGLPLNMSSLQVSLSERTQPHTRSIPDAPQRQLPIPQPSPAQTTRNVVDQLQDQRLRSVHSSGVFPRASMSYSSDVEPVPATSAAHSSAPVSVSATLNAGGSMSYLPTTVSETAESQPQLNFGTSSLLQTMPISAVSATYSNFRNYNLPAPTSIEPMPTMARQSSQTNLYSFSPDRQDSKPASTRSEDEALVSGHRYTLVSQGQVQGQGPRQPHQPQHHGSMEHLRRSSCGHQGVSVHHSASIPDLARSY